VYVIHHERELVEEAATVDQRHAEVAEEGDVVGRTREEAPLVVAAGADLVRSAVLRLEVAMP
jgi:hypothetical protein